MEILKWFVDISQSKMLCSCVISEYVFLDFYVKPQTRFGGHDVTMNNAEY